MYRKAGSQSALSGVPSGPYTGKTRTIEASLLSAGTRARIVKALTGRGEPSPIAIDRSSRISFLSEIPSWGMSVAVAVLGTTFAVGFDNPASSWGHQPIGAFAIYASAASLFALSLLSALRRQFHSGSDVLRPGRYLFPLDVIEVAPANRNGRQKVTVRPLGNARDARLEGNELQIIFEGGDIERFRVRTAADGEMAMRQLDLVQATLEELSYASTFEKSFAHDLFFDLRVDDSWASVAPSDNESARLYILSPFAPLVVASLAFVFAIGLFTMRRSVGDRLLREREAWEQKKAARTPPIPDIPEPKAPPSADECIAALEKKGSRPEVVAIMKATIGDQSVIPITFNRKQIRPQLEAVDWDAAERRLIGAFERVFSEDCPVSVVSFGRSATGFGVIKTKLVIDYVVTWNETPILVPGVTDKLKVTPFEVAFDVTFGPKVTFRLTMPPVTPDKLTMVSRPKSIFTIPMQPILPENTFDERVYSAMTARAFDRLYDEIYGLFFSGDPRVPVRNQDMGE